MPSGGNRALGPGWLRPQRLEYVPLDNELAVVRVAANLARGLTPPGDAALVAGAPHTIVRAPVLGSVTRRPSRRMRAADHLLWRVTFALPLELVESPETLFALVARGHMPTRLPEPNLSSLEALCRHWELGPRGSGLLSGLAWRRAAALGTAVAVAGSSALPPVAALASSGHTGGASVPSTVVAHHLKRGAPQAHTAGHRHTVKAGDHATMNRAGGHKSGHVVQAQHTRTKPKHDAVHHRPAHADRGGSHVTPSGPVSHDAAPATTSARSLTPTAGSHRHHPHHQAASHSQALGTASGLPPISQTAPAGLIGSGAVANPDAAHGKGEAQHHPGGHHSATHHPTGHDRGSGHQQAGHQHPQAGHHDQGTGDHHAQPSFSGGTGLQTLSPTSSAHLRHHSAPSRGEESSETGPETTTAPSSGAYGSTNSFWTTGMGSSSGEVALLSHHSGLFTKGLQPPAFLIPIYKKAGQRFHIPWEVLAAINSIETDYGRNLNVSSAGAVGWMQFMPSTWAQYGMSVSGKGIPNPYDPTDAIFSAARYLAANGGARHLRKAIFAYNHALWYVDSVMWRAGLITDHAQHARHLDGYSLPLDARYMHVFGRTDDGLDIEDAPDGAAVYSITPGVVTAVASDPSGFGPNYPVIRVTKGPLTGQYIYYGHVAASLVKVGQHVVAGQPIAIMGHTGDAVSLGHGHIEIGFSDAYGDPLNHHGAVAWTPSGAAMRRVLVALAAGFHIKVR